jgi:hypothetical protein
MKRAKELLAAFAEEAAWDGDFHPMIMIMGRRDFIQQQLPNPEERSFIYVSRLGATEISQQQMLALISLQHDEEKPTPSPAKKAQPRPRAPQGSRVLRPSPK